MPGKVFPRPELPFSTIFCMCRNPTKGDSMSKVLFLFFAGVFVGTAIYELGKRTNTKWEFICKLEKLVEKGADELFVSAVTKEEKEIIPDFKA
jgi:hypothetical protein